MRPDAGPRVGPGTAAPATSVASGPMAQRLVVIGGGPAGNQAATTAARLGADVTLIERDVLGGAAHLWDCIPSKAMIATGDAMTLLRQAEGMGLRGVDAAKPDINWVGKKVKIEFDEASETVSVPYWRVV